MIRKTPVILLVIIMTFGLILPAFAETEGSLPEGFALVVSAGEGAEAEIRPQTVRGEQWLFIPSFCDLSSLSFRGTGDDFSIRYNGAAANAADGLLDLTPVLTDVPACPLICLILAT